MSVTLVVALQHLLPALILMLRVIGSEVRAAASLVTLLLLIATNFANRIEPLAGLLLGAVLREGLYLPTFSALLLHAFSVA